ncbi:MAG: autotransporter-associated beta strand repeat-containing protein [Akkermansiaceae bacterium]|jgi:autotransporter-associated beta strand protein|nr:autotransporter-associated beta strand repeat-containing protein [Akkermansiaceae bacterium]
MRHAACHHIFLTAGLSGLLAATAMGADQTWNTAGPSDAWNTTDLNWDGGVAWTNGNTAIFSGTGEAITVGTVTAAGMTFSGTDYVLGSGTITNSGTITTSESATINSNIALSAGQSWSAAAGKTLTLGGTISGSSTLTYGGSGSYLLNGNNTNNANITIDAATVTVASGKTLFASGFGFAGLRTVTLQNSGKLVLPAWEYAVVGQTNDGSNNFVITSGGILEMTAATMTGGVNKGIQVTSGTGYFRTPGNTAWSGSFSGRDFQVSNGATLVFDGAGNFTNSRFVTGAGNVTKNDGGTLTLQSTNSFSGTLTVNGGTLIASATTTGGTASSTGNNNAIIVNSGATLRYTGSRGAGYHTGNVTINGGTVTFDNTDMSWANGRTVSFDTDSGTINGTGQWRRRDANNRISVTATGSGSTISVAELNLFDNSPIFEVADGAAAADLTVSSTLTGSSNLRKDGAGTLVISGTTTTYSGTTQVNAGTLKVDGTLSGNLAVNSTATLSGSGTLTGVVTANTGSTIDGTPTFSAAVNMAGTAVIQPGGIGNLGSVTCNASLALGGETRMDISKNGVTLDSDEITGNGSVSMTGTLKVTATGDPLVLGDSFTLFTNTGGFSGSFTGFDLPALSSGLTWDTSSLAIDGTITVSNFTVAPSFNPPAGGYVGPQSVTLSSEPGATIYYTTDGSAPTTSSPSGPSPINGVTIPLNSTVTVRAFATKSGLGDSEPTSATYTTIPTGVWNVDADGTWSDSANWLSNAVPDGSGAAVEFTLPQSAPATVTLDSNRIVGAMTFSNTNDFNWTINTNSGSLLTLATGSGAPLVTVLDNSATLGTVITGNQGLTKAGPGTLILTGANSYTGGTILDAGTLRVQNNNALGGAPGGTLTINDGTLEFPANGSNYTIANPVTVPNGATATIKASGLYSGIWPNLFVSGLITNDGNLALIGGADIGGHDQLHVSGGLTGNAPTISGHVRLLTTPCTWNADSTITISGASDLLELRSTSEIMPSSTTITVNAGRFMLNGVVTTMTQTIKALNGSGGTVTCDWGTNTLRIGAGDGSGSYGGVIANGAGTAPVLRIEKIGNGTQTFSGVNTYTGSTTISGGTLALGASGALPDTTAIALGAATLSAGAAVTDTTGTLDATAAATIDLGAGATLAFADSSAIDWTGGSLEITGAFVSGSSLRFGTTNAGLTSTQLSLISCEGFSNFALDENGFLTASSGGDYYDWATTNNVTGGPDGDSDNDGILNLVEYALDLNPAGSDGLAGNYNPATGVISFTKRQEAIDNGDLTYIIETSPDLTTWTPAVTHAPGDLNTSISTTLTVDDTRKFARLSVTTSAPAP